jgi:hypothetical protein
MRRSRIRVPVKPSPGMAATVGFIDRSGRFSALQHNNLYKILRVREYLFTK